MYEGEESDNNDADDDETTTDWIDKRTNKRNGGSSIASLSSSGVVTEFLLLEKAKSIVWNYFGSPARSGKFVQWYFADIITIKIVVHTQIGCSTH